MKESNQNLGFVRIGNQPPVTSLTLNRIARWERSVVESGQYIPYLKVKQTPTVGKGSKVFNPDSDATHEALSIQETQLLRYLTFLPNVISIKTQYPLLPITATLEIADALGVKHPSYTPKGKNIRDELKINQAVAMTTDYLIDYYDGNGELKQCAIALKSVDANGKFSDKEKRDFNITQKLNVEAEYCRQDGLEWRLVTSAHTCFQEHFARNLLEAEVRSEDFVPESELIEIEKAFMQWFDVMPRACFSPLLIEIAASLNVSTGRVRVAFWKLVWLQRLPVDLAKEIVFNRPLPLGGEQCSWQ